ncbi:c-type cytochrome biogenesis protein CcmI [Alteromonas flava]|uniref:c-type cytochrome biogenesis protein CcmI n=1 Tax=Alteromonas flava TaxID=2048003 RepID=UPI000C290621|nr:c-type cytochrome biogenesis protein CcmI [Alteromonas flava]
MTWTVFYIVVVGFLSLLAVCIALPWFHRRNQRVTDQLRNAQIVKQRLSEIEKEHTEGLISATDKEQAIVELKLALVDEVKDQEQSSSESVRLPILVGLILAFGVGGVVYYQTNHLKAVDTLVQANASISELSDKLIAVANNQAEISPEELQLLALAIRQRLRATPEDDQAWLNLGRLYMSMGFSEQSIEAFERAFEIAPEDVNTRLSFAQALMLTGVDENLQRSERILDFELTQQPQNDNIRLMLTVVTAQLGKLAKAQENFDLIKTKMSPTSDMYQSLTARLAELGGETSKQDETNLTGFSVQVSITSELSEKLPTNAFLFVFAQDAEGSMRVPAAVVKLPLSELPTKVILTEQQAMLSTFTLNDIQRARLVARISNDENVEAMQGELQGMTEIPVSAGQIVEAEVLIDQEIQ